MSEQNHLSDEQLLRMQWRELNKKVETLERKLDASTASLQAVKGNMSRLEKLRHQVRMLMILCFVSCAWVMPAMKHLGCPSVLCMFIGLFFLVMGFLKLRLFRMLSDVDFGTSSVCDTLRQMERVILFRARSRWIGWITGTPIIIFQLNLFYNINPALMWSGVAGLIAGLAIGLSLDRRASRLLNEIRNTLAEGQG